MASSSTAWHPMPEAALTAARGQHAALTRKGYIICSEPRSGSTYLTGLLRSTGVLGRPAESFSSDEQVAEVLLDPERYFQRWIAEKSTPNGVYGLKVFPHQFDLVERSRWIEHLPELHFIHFHREDLLGQALSSVRSLQTGQYESSQPMQAEPFYDRRHIAAMLHRIAHGHARWQVWFARNGITPIRLAYEDVLKDPQGTVQALANLLDVRDRIVIDPGKLHVKVQRDERTQVWRERFLSESGDLTYLDDEYGRLRPAVRRLRAALSRGRRAKDAPVSG